MVIRPASPRPLRMAGWISIPSFFLLLLLLTACDPLFQPELAIIERKTSPDGKHDALCLRVDTGTTTNTATWVAIVNAGSAKADLDDAALVAEGTEAVRMCWRDGRLEVHHDFTNGQVSRTRSPIRGVEILHLGK